MVVQVKVLLVAAITRLEDQEDLMMVLEDKREIWDLTQELN